MPSEKPLTKKQRTILDAILFLIRKGELPTVREVGALVGLRSPATVLKHLRVLDKAAFISLSGKSRGIRIADPELLERVIQDAGHQDTGHQDMGHQDTSFHGAGIQDRGIRGGRGEDSSVQRVGADAAPYGTGPYGTGPYGTGDPLNDVLQTHLPEISRLTGSRLTSSPRAAPHEHGAGSRIHKLFAPHRNSPRIPLVGAIAAGQPFESYSDGYVGDEISSDDFSAADPYASGRSSTGTASTGSAPTLGIDPKVFCDSGDVLALKVEGDSMVNAGILHGDFAIIRRQSSVEEGEIAAVIIDGEGTLKRWRTRRSTAPGSADSEGAGSEGADLEGADLEGGRSVCLQPENDSFDPIEITEAGGKDVLVIGKYVGLVRGIEVFHG